MRILHLLPSGRTGGIERLCADIASISEEEHHFYFFFGGGVCADSIKKNKQTVIRNIAKSNLISEYRYFRDYLRNNKFDAVIIHFPSPIILLFSLLAPRGIPLIMYIHADPDSLFDERLVRLLMRLLKPRIKGNICISKFVSENLKSDAEKKIIYNGTNISLGDRLKKRNDIIHLVYVGRIVEDKGIQNIIELLVEVQLPFSMTIVGDGNYKSTLEKMVVQNGLSSSISFVGESADVSKWLESADLFVHPAICKEGFGITLIEAMACGVPCIAYKRGAIGEIITDNIDGFLVAEFSIESFGKRLDEVFDLYYLNPDMYLAIANQAHRSSKKFSSRKYVENLEDYINELCYKKETN